MRHEHPSFLALDRMHLGLAPAEVTAHVDDCAVCRQHLDGLGTVVAGGFGSLQSTMNARRRTRWSWIAGFSSLAAAACAVLLFIGHRTAVSDVDQSVYVGAKGFRSVWIYVKHGLETELWDGKKPIAPGDRLRLKIDPGTYRHVQIYSLDAADSATLLFESDLVPGRTLTLPDAWEVDDAPAAERLFVVFGQQAVEPAWHDWLAGTAGSNVAVLPFVLVKGADAGAQGP